VDLHAHAQAVTRDIPYATAHPRQVLDVHAPAGAKNLPVLFWIHAVTHVARDKGIPPFLILHIAGNPDTGAQARRLAAVLETAGISARVVAGRETTHASINDNIGVANDP
jgi:acetyl esterase/lipase